MAKEGERERERERGRTGNGKGGGRKKKGGGWGRWRVLNVPLFKGEGGDGSLRSPSLLTAVQSRVSVARSLSTTLHVRVRVCM